MSVLYSSNGKRSQRQNVSLKGGSRKQQTAAHRKQKPKSCIILIVCTMCLTRYMLELAFSVYEKASTERERKRKGDR